MCRCLMFSALTIPRNSRILKIWRPISGPDTKSEIIQRHKSHAVVRFYWRWKIATQGVNLPLHWLFLPSLRRQAEALHGLLFPFLIQFMNWRCIFYWAVLRETKYSVYPLYSPYISSAVFIIGGEPVEAGLRQGNCWKRGMLCKCLLSIKGRSCNQTPLVN